MAQRPQPQLRVLSAAVPRRSGMPDPPLPAPGLSEILLWRRVSLTGGVGGGLGEEAWVGSALDKKPSGQTLGLVTAGLGVDSMVQEEPAGQWGTQCALYAALG